MGWLRDLMRHADPQVRSFGALARSVLASPQWAEEQKPQPRSLAALFSKLDRNIELEWLADRRPAQQALAVALNCPVTRIRREIDGHLGHVDERSAVWRIEGVRYARALELGHEPLPPGLPQALSQPYAWGGLLWLDATPTELRLVRSWLEARGAARCIQVDSWREASAQLPSAGSVLVELSPRAEFAELPTRPPRAGLCVASAHARQAVAEHHLGNGWDLVSKEPVKTWLGDLLRWLEERLPADGHFERASALKWLETAAESGVVKNLETALGLAGLLDELGMDQAKAKDVTTLARRYVDARLQDASREGNADAQWLLHSGFDVLVGLLTQSLTDFHEAPRPSHTHEAWMRLVPPELQKSIDTEWVRISLARSGSRTTVRDLEKALNQMPPGAYRVVRALIASGLLVESEVDKSDAEPLYELGPAWLFNAALGKALDQLCHSAPFEWGEALLNHSIAPRIVEALQTELNNEHFEFLDELAELDAASSAAEAVAIETAFRLVGVGVLEDLELAPDYLEALWQLQSQQWLDLTESAPTPRFLAPETLTRLCPVLEVGAWYLAAWAISEHLPTDQQKPLSLAPWAATSDKLTPGERESLRSVAELIYRHAANRQSVVQRTACFALAARLGSQFSELVGDDVALLVPQQVLAAAVGKQLSWTKVRPLLSDRVLFDATFQLAVAQKLPWPRIARAIWQAWLDAGKPQLGAEPLSPESSLTDRLWPNVPKDLLQAWNASAWIELPIPFALMTEEHWEVLLPQWPELRTSQDPESFWQHVPRKLAIDALESGLLGAQDGLAVLALWDRFPEAIIDTLGHWLGKSEVDRAWQLLQCSPPPLTERVAGVLRESTLTHRARTEHQLLALRWARSRLWNPGEAWRAAYDLLSDLEERRRRFPRH